MRENNYTWSDAIIIALGLRGSASTMEEIYNQIVQVRLYVPKNENGTPHRTIASTISVSIKTEGDNSPFKKITAGVYELSNIGKQKYKELTSNEYVNHYNNIHNELEGTSKKDISPLFKRIDIIKHLKDNQNIILHGAPGTGKTYLAKEIAKAMCGNIKDIKTLEDSGQFKMVQFHPSYDYTDFVEGLRPENDGKGNIVFKRKDGVFKEFCKKAVNASLIKSTPTSNETNIITEKELKKAWDIFVKIIDDNKSIGYKLELDDGKSTPNLTIGEFIKDSAQYENKAGDKRIEWGIREQYCSWGYILNIHREFKCPQMISKNGDIEKVAPGTTHQYLNYIYKTVYEIAGKQVCRANNNPYFIFLIDEINRGDMSKIFGDLFYAIDPGYRGEKGKIDTQYQNLIPKDGDKNFDENNADPFRCGFYVPDNVYIIGTMNDIDRSVESMDFAMRRRFQFIEVTAEDRAEGMGLKTKKQGEEGYDKTEAYNRMTNLNNCIISKEIGLSKAYQIGGSYFLKKKIKDGKEISVPIESDEEFNNLWDYRLKGLLKEYLRGEEDKVIEEKLEKKLKPAFNLQSGHLYNEEE